MGIQTLVTALRNAEVMSIDGVVYDIDFVDTPYKDGEIYIGFARESDDYTNELPFSTVEQLHDEGKLKLFTMNEIEIF